MEGSIEPPQRPEGSRPPGPTRPGPTPPEMPEHPPGADTSAVAEPPPLPDSPPASSPPPMPAPPPVPGPPPVPAPPPTAENVVDDEPQSYNDQQGVDVRPCPNCGGNFVFDISAQKLTCPHCGSQQDIVHELGASVDENALDNFSIQELAGKGKSHIEGEKEVVCQNCGGHTTFIGSTTATRCPYCATPLQRSDVHEAPDRLEVDGVLPFSVDEKKAEELLGHWVNKRWFAPNEFKKYSTNGAFSSVYAAYFTYDAQAATSYVGQRGTTYTRTVGSGNNRRTVTETRWNRASGHVRNSFDDITILANTGFEQRYIDELEPWPTGSLRPFQPDYMAGHLSRTYDKDVTECFDTAKMRMAAEIDHTIRRDIGGDKQRIDHKATNLSSVTYKHVLLPIWLLTVLYNGQPWQVFMNGVTGEIHGQRPYSNVKIGLAVAAVMLLIIIFVIARSASGG